MAWIYLIAAGIFEIVLAIALKQSEGFSRITPTVILIASVLASMFLLSLAVKTIPIGTAYAIWTSIGVVGIVLIGIFLFGESAAPVRLASIGLILLGIVGLKLVTD